jgi:hypothetical protein
LKRLRLTASAIAATSLSSLGVAGAGVSVAHAASGHGTTGTPGTGYSGKGFDTCTAPSDTQMDDWYQHSPYHAVGVYIGGSSYLAQSCATAGPGYTPAWVQHQSATGWSMWALYPGTQPVTLATAADPSALGRADATDAAAKAVALGFGRGTVIFADLEPYYQSTTTPKVVQYLQAFAGQLALEKGGFLAGLYGNSKPAGTPSAIGDAAADPALQNLLAAVDIANTTAGQANFTPTTGDPSLSPEFWAKHQRIHQYFLNDTETFGSTTLTVDADMLDLAPNPISPPGTVDRLAGGDRIGTAIVTSQKLWPNAAATLGDGFSDGRPAAQAAVLSRQDQPADALGGSALAAHVGGPLLLTGTAKLDLATAGELTRTLTPGSTVFVLGGTSALSPAVFNAVKALGFNPIRLGGASRYATAVTIAQHMALDMRQWDGQPSVQRVLLATGLNFPDALAAGTAAGATPDTVLLLTADAAMPPETAGYLGQISGQTTGPKSASVYPVGGSANKAAKTLKNVPAANLNLDLLVGPDRYATAALVALQFFGDRLSPHSGGFSPHSVGIAIGDNWPDALSGGAAMGTLGGPLLLTTQTALPPATAGYYIFEKPNGSLDASHVFGGATVITNVVLTQLKTAMHP